MSATPEPTQEATITPCAWGVIDPRVSSEIGLADLPHWVLMSQDDRGVEWSFFTSDLAMGEMMEHAIEGTTTDEFVSINRDALPWIRRGWPAALAAEFEVGEPA